MAALEFLFADGAYLRLARLQSMSEWWHWLLLLAACGAILAAVALLYHYDGRELPRGVRWLLATLRVCAFLGVLFWFLNLEKRSEQQVVKNSRVLLLIDASQSMGLPDAGASAAAGASRIERVAAALADGDLLGQLRANHDVVAYRFDEGSSPLEIASFSKVAQPDTADSRVQDAAEQQLDSSVPGQAAGAPPPTVDWRRQLAPRGAETRLGDALRRLVNQERGGPVAGIVLWSDGRSNAGVEYTAAVAAAQEAGIPVFTVGLGSDQRPVNVRVADVEAPSRIYPGDHFSVTAYLQAYGLAGRTAKVELYSAPADSAAPAQPGDFEEERRVKLAADGELLPVRFDVQPDKQGRRTYRVRLAPLEQGQDRSDDERTADVQVVERKTRVLLLAGGPTREYQFLRNLLYRDRDTTVDILLQSGRPGISQEADQLLSEFPKQADELFPYDAIVAFDPDWLALSEPQIDLLERWAAEQAGGLIVVAGPVHTPEWANRQRGDRRIDTLKGLYPVVFYSRGSATLDLGRFGGETAWPLQFTRDGSEAEFLWLEDDALGSEQAWASFGGVYGYYALKDAKTGARVYARFSNPETAIDSQLPIYFAGHFYGAGRVFFMGSGEMWRLRGLDEKYFDRVYTKLIRWVSQGRLLRDSSRGLLLVEKDRCLLGDQVTVRAILTNARHEPLTDEEASAALIRPDGSRTTLTLRRVADSPREGMYTGQFTALEVGKYRLEMAPPEGGEGELLSGEVWARLPDLEVERPERNDPLLKDIAEKTGGQYYVGVEAAVDRRGARAPLFRVLEPQDQVTLLPGTPDRDFERKLMTWLMGLICGVLCLEWLIRRLAKLA